MAAITKILVPVDFSEASRKALRYACSLAEAFDASLCVVHAIENPYLPGGYMEFYAPPAEYFEQVERDTRKSLEDVLTPDEKAKFRATLVQRKGSPAGEILALLAEQPDIDLVVMATHGRGGMARLMMGSVTDRVVRLSPCPVLTLRAPEAPVEENHKAA